MYSKNYYLLSFFSYFYLSLEEKVSHINASFEIIIICVSVHFKLLRLFFSFLILLFLLYCYILKLLRFNLCSDSFGCLKLSDILQSFSAPLNEQQAWAIIFQVDHYKRSYNFSLSFNDHLSVSDQLSFISQWPFISL